MICPYCEGKVNYVSSRAFYGVDYGTNVYFCNPCDARVGTHRKSKRPLGTLANADLRNQRKKCHELLDPYWKSGKYTRDEVYRRMALAMNLPKSKAHIGMFNSVQCEQIISMFRVRKKKYTRPKKLPL